MAADERLTRPSRYKYKQPFVTFDIWALWPDCPDVKNYKWRLNPVWPRMLHSS